MLFIIIMLFIATVLLLSWLIGIILSELPESIENWKYHRQYEKNYKKLQKYYEKHPEERPGYATRTLKTQVLSGKQPPYRCMYK